MDKTNVSIVMKKDVCFHELSVPFPITHNEDIDLLIQKYADTIKEANNQGFNKVRYEKGVEYIMLRDDYSLAQYLCENSTRQSVRVLLATQTKPYIPEDSPVEEAYVMNQYYIKFKDDEIHAEGFAAAALSESMAVGMENREWTEICYDVLEKRPESNVLRKINVYYAYNPDFFASQSFLKWANINLPPEIVDCRIPYMNKKIQLPQHHGKDVLFKLAKRLVREPYVKEIPNSIDRDSKQKNFISGINGNIIYITLVGEGGFGLAVSTTARNEREASYIATLIKNKFS